MTEHKLNEDPQQRDLLGDLVQLKLADDEGSLDQIRAELTQLTQIVGQDAELRAALSDRSLASETRESLIEGLLTKANAHQRTVYLAKRAAASTDRSIVQAIGLYLDHAAHLRGHCRATAVSARPLTEQQVEKLRTELERIYGKPVDLSLIVDEAVIGGVKVTVDDDIIDGTIATSLAEARQQIG